MFLVIYFFNYCIVCIDVRENNIKNFGRVLKKKKKRNKTKWVLMKIKRKLSKKF